MVLALAGAPTRAKVASMGRQHEIHIREQIDAPVDAVFERFADHTWFTSLFGSSCERVVDGEGEPNGLGSVRRIGPGPLSFDETIVVFEPGQRLHYTITRGSPLKNHMGEIEFIDEGGKTVVDYRIRFEGKLPGAGTLTKAVLERAWKLNARKKLDRI